MADEIIGLKIQIEGGDKVEKTVKSFRTELREAQLELVKMQQSFGDISPEAQKAAQKVAEMRDQLKDANEVAGLFDPEQKFSAISNAAQGIASGFIAVQGAMALVGGESKEVEAAIMKVQAAMALAQGLSGVRAGVEDFKRLGGVLGNIGIVQKANAAANTLAAGTMRLFSTATTATATSFKALKAAIVTTGIGALIVGIGIGISKLIEWTSRTNDATAAQRELNKAVSEQANRMTDEIVDVYEQDLRLQVARAKAHGATETEIADITRKSHVAIRKERQDEYDRQRAAGLDASAAKKALDKADTDAEIFELGERARANDQAEQKSKAARDKAAAQRKADQDKAKADAEQAKQAALQAEKQTADEVFALRHSAEEVELRELEQKFKQRQDAYLNAGRNINELLEAEEIERGAIEKKYADERLAQKNADFLTQKDREVTEQDAQLAREKEYSEARKKLAEEESQTKIRAAQAVSGALDSFAALAGEQTAAGKAFAVASATIQAILGAQQAFTSLSVIPIVGPALGAVAAAGAIAAGIANVKKILAVKVPGQGSSGSAPSAVSFGGSAPLSPQAAPTQTTRLDQQSINNMGNATFKTFVVESDITGSQQRINRIQTAAKFR